MRDFSYAKGPHSFAKCFNSVILDEHLREPATKIERRCYTFSRKEIEELLL